MKYCSPFLSSFSISTKCTRQQTCPISVIRICGWKSAYTFLWPFVSYTECFFCILSTPFYLKTIDPTRFFLNDCNHPFKWWIDNINIKIAFYELFINEPVPPFLTTIFEKLEFAIFNFWFWHNIIKINAAIQCLWVCKGYLISISSIWGHYN